MDLGQKREHGLAMAAPDGDKEPKISYPVLSLSDKCAEQFSKENEPKLGSEYAATVRIKVTSLTSDEYGKRIAFDVMDLDDVTEESEETDEDVAKAKEDYDKEEGDAEEKALGYKRKTEKKEAPSLKASDLAD